MIILLIAGLLLLVIQTPASKFNVLSKQSNIEETNKITNDIKTTENKIGASENNGQQEKTNAIEYTNQSGLADDTNSFISDTEYKLKKALSQINGVGQTEVVVTVKASKEYVVEKDNPYSRDNLNETDAQGGSRVNSNMKDEESTVFWKDSNGNEIPFISKEVNPEITGVLVVCQGGEKESVKKDITEALQALFDLEVHKIKVAKMVTVQSNANY